MTEFRRYARFQLVVAVVAALTVVGLFATTGNAMASLAGFSVLALLGVQGMKFSRGLRSPIQDERDEAILRKAVAMGYTVLWLFLVAWGVFIPLAFGDDGQIPMVFVAPVVLVAWWLVVIVRSIAVLVLDGGGP